MTQLKGLALIQHDLINTLTAAAEGATAIPVSVPGTQAMIVRRGADVTVSIAGKFRELTPIEINLLARLFAEADRRQAAIFRGEEYDLGSDRDDD